MDSERLNVHFAANRMHSPGLYVLITSAVLQQIHLGSFNTEEEAAQAFDQEAIRLRGPGTFTNFPSENYLIGDVDSDSGQPKKSTQRRPPNGIRWARSVTPVFCHPAVPGPRHGACAENHG